MDWPVVCGLAITPVKGTRLRPVDQIDLGASGARDNRRFCVIDDRDRMVNGKRLGALQEVVAEYWGPERRLTLTFPAGVVASAVVKAGPAVAMRFYSRTVEGRVVNGPLSEALSEHAEQRLRLVEAVGAVDRGRRGAVSLISRGSLERLAVAAGKPRVDVRRFRMLIEIDGVEAHAEDGWVHRRARVGDALVRFAGHVGRCLITSRDPETGRIDLPTLEILGDYRGDARTTEPLPFGVYGEVLEEGMVRVGDRVSLVE
jgi:MOSC domain-containing protein